MMLKYRSSLPMFSQRSHPEKIYIPFCIKNAQGHSGYTDENNPFEEAWLSCHRPVYAYV